jgi:hypothetical protein
LHSVTRIVVGHTALGELREAEDPVTRYEILRVKTLDIQPRSETRDGSAGWHTSFTKMQPFLGQPVYPKQLPGKGNQKVREERRLVWRVLGLWKEVAGGKRFPSHEEIESWVRDEDGKNCLLIAVESPIELSHFIVVGVNLAVALCPNDTLAGVLLSKVPRVVSARRGLMIEGSATLRGTCILYRSLLLPLSDRGIVIDHIFGATNYRFVPAADEPPMGQGIFRTQWI